ncbi:rubrerythrin family protein [Methanobacterium formicicum]|uniref:Rubrerythrin n=1 Tax=Methanobacterium formicicum (strain DSM 3637 / PP1) TaxID=1204725 RepID=K2QAA3_METFP|nr:rubrerythrin family protein [Methanobacterium formicicum]EKF84856.1 rubrerythrin [Methanobacterium formicicum DSM 3637]
MSTMDNLNEAFAGESKANRKYLAYAKKADEEGHPQVAKLFRAAAEAETVHAHNHLTVMSGIKTTEENLKDAIEGEIEEFEEMYPNFIEEAKADENEKAVWTFDVANQVEEIHAGLYQKALEALGNNEEVDYYVCRYCGNTVENEAPDVCPVCKALKSDFFNVD